VTLCSELYSLGCLSLSQAVGGVKVSDCIAKKYYYFSTDHTACVLKSAGADTSGTLYVSLYSLGVAGYSICSVIDACHTV